jgi:endonuclease III related protein
MTRGRQFRSMYQALLKEFGPQKWWPADTPFEVAVGAVLTQSTNWKNVEKAIRRLKAHHVLTPEKLMRLPERKLASLIRPAGYYHIKARRLKNFLAFLFSRYKGRMQVMRRAPYKEVRAGLLGVKGIGQETADSILLYALNKPVFVIDAYTRRMLGRHGLTAPADDYSRLQDLFMNNLKNDVSLFNEYHALIVRLAKVYCLKNDPRCPACPLRSQVNHGQ